VKLARIALAIGLVAALSTAAASSAAKRSQASSTLKIGVSLSLSGDFSDSGKAAKRGYELWRDVINAHGGLLGKKVQLTILDDTSSPTQAATNYQNLITHNKVNFVFGPFSTLLTAPSATVAARYGYAFIEPAGGGPKVFALKLHNVFFAQPAPVLNSADIFAHYILSLPKAKRPKTAAYPSLDDPFASPIVDRVRQLLEAGGINTVYHDIYPAENVDMTPIVAKIQGTKPDAVIGGTQSNDAYAQIKAMIQLKFNPKFLFYTNGPNNPAEFPSKVGLANVKGIFSTGSWFPQQHSPGNKTFVKAFVKKYGGTAAQIDPTSAESYACGQILQAVVTKLHSTSNAKIIAALHKGTWPSVEGRLRWNSIGEPQGQDLLLEWVGTKLYPVYPPKIALHKPTTPKPPWSS